MSYICHRNIHSTCHQFDYTAQYFNKVAIIPELTFIVGFVSVILLYCECSEKYTEPDKMLASAMPCDCVELAGNWPCYPF